MISSFGVDPTASRTGLVKFYVGAEIYPQWRTLAKIPKNVSAVGTQFRLRPTLSSPLLRAIHLQALPFEATSLADYAPVLDLLPSAIWLVDHENKLIFVNRAWTELTGKTYEQQQRDGWHALLHESSRAEMIPLWWMAFNAKREYRGDLQIIHASGRAVWIHDSATPLYGKDGTFLGYVGASVDFTQQKKAELFAQAAATRIHLIANNVPALVAQFEMSDGFRCSFANAAYARTYGFTVEELANKKLYDIIGAAAYATIQPYVDACIAGDVVSYTRSLKAADGSDKVIEVNLIPHFGGSADATSAFVLINDITKHRRAEAQARDSEDRLRKFFNATTEGIIFSDSGTISDCNDAVAHMMRLMPEDLIGRSIFEFVAPQSRNLVLRNVGAGFERPYEITAVRADGTQFTAEVHGKSGMESDNNHRMTVVRDISDRKTAEAHIQFLAHHDLLTGLPNRAQLNTKLEAAVDAASRGETQLAVLFIDLDNFKTVNDSLGHHAGDALLKRVSEHLLSTCHADDILGRLGGDEFLVVTRLDVLDALPFAQGLAHAIAEPFTIDGQTLTAHCSIGVSCYPRDGKLPDELIRNADAAMYVAKERGRNNVQLFTSSLQRAASQALATENGLRRALRNSEFELYYQPEISLATGALCGVEALIRWNHPELGLVSPDYFIPIAEARGLIVPIGQWVLNTACKQIQSWKARGLDHLIVAVNLSAIQFQQQSLADDVAQALAEHETAGNCLELELTESLFLEDVVTASKVLYALKDLGVMLAVDDFGTGYSSLSYLKRYPIDKLKIDRSFVRDIPGDADDVAITTAIINLATSLEITVLAEGVENRDQLNFLREHGCNEAQGYFIARPMPAEAFFNWAMQHNAQSFVQ